MTIDPAPGADEIAAILAALDYAKPASDPSVPAEPSRWRMAGRNYAGDMPEHFRR